MLVIACSATKRPDDAWLAAGDRYDGPLWRTWRAHGGPRVPTFALSALFGLIPAETEIPDYNVRLGHDVEIAALAPLVRLQASRPPGIGDVIFVGGAEYVSLLELSGVRVRRLSASGIGYQREALRRWLTDVQGQAS